MTLVGRGLGLGSVGSYVLYGLGSDTLVAGYVKVPACQVDEVKEHLTELGVSEHDIVIGVAEHDVKIDVAEHVVVSDVVQHDMDTIVVEFEFDTEVISWDQMVELLDRCVEEN